MFCFRFFAGFADTLTFGVTSHFRNAAYSIFDIDDLTDTNSQAYSNGGTASVIYDAALGAATGWVTGGAKAAGKEFSHWIPHRYLKKTNNNFIINKFGKSKFNGNYVSPRRHAMHDTYRHINNVKPFPSIARQLDRVPRVYYGTIIGGVYGKLSTYNVDSNDK